MKIIHQSNHKYEREQFLDLGFSKVKVREFLPSVQSIRKFLGCTQLVPLTINFLLSSFLVKKERKLSDGSMKYFHFGVFDLLGDFNDRFQSLNAAACSPSYFLQLN